LCKVAIVYQNQFLGHHGPVQVVDIIHRFKVWVPNV
jgi:hypothetical protein